MLHVENTARTPAADFRAAATAATLAELFADPIMETLMAADHVDRRDFDTLIETARRNLRRPQLGRCA